MFNERLLEFRNKLGLNKRQMAKKLDINESYYNVIENGKRNPSKTIMDRLVVLSEKPEEYWIYGIDNEDDYIVARSELKCIRRVIDQLLELNLDTDDLFKDVKKGSIEELIGAAFKADVEHIKNKKKEQ